MLKLYCIGSTYDEVKGWTVAACVYHYFGTNRKRAINWAIKKVEQDCPHHKEYSVEIMESDNV
jgi:hypothetical protein